MNWSLIGNVLLAILFIAIVVLLLLYYFGKKLEKRQVEQQDLIEAAKQVVTLMAIDKWQLIKKD